MESFALTPPDPDILALLRLYLEKYEALAEEDRKLLCGVLWMLMNPPVVVSVKGGVELQR